MDPRGPSTDPTDPWRTPIFPGNIRTPHYFLKAVLKLSWCCCKTACLLLQNSWGPSQQSKIRTPDSIFFKISTICITLYYDWLLHSCWIHRKTQILCWWVLVSSNKYIYHSLSAVSWSFSQLQLLAASQLGPPLQLLFSYVARFYVVFEQESENQKWKIVIKQ